MIKISPDRFGDFCEAFSASVSDLIGSWHSSSIPRIPIGWSGGEIAGKVAWLQQSYTIQKQYSQTLSRHSTALS